MYYIIEVFIICYFHINIKLCGYFVLFLYVFITVFSTAMSSISFYVVFLDYKMSVSHVCVLSVGAGQPPTATSAVTAAYVDTTTTSLR